MGFLSNLFHTVKNFRHTLDNNKGKAFHYLASSFLAFVLIAVSYPAYAGTGVVGRIVNSFLGLILDIVGNVSVWLSSLAQLLLPQISQTSKDLIAEPRIIELWNVSINIANAIFLLVLVVMAVAIVLRKAGGYDFKKAFSLLVIGVVGANATYLFVKFMNGLSMYMASVIPTIFRDGTDGTPKIFTIAADIQDSMATVFADGKLGAGISPWNVIVAIALSVIVLIVLLKVSFILIERTIQLIVRLLIGPIIFASSLFSGNDSGIKKWFAEIISWALTLPIIFFFLEASTVFFGDFDPDTFKVVATFDPDSADGLAGGVMGQLIYAAIGLYLAWYAGMSHKLLIKASDFTNNALGKIDKTATGFAGKTLPTAIGITAFKGVDLATSGLSKIPGLGWMNNSASKIAGFGHAVKEWNKNRFKETYARPIEQAKINAARGGVDLFSKESKVGRVMEAISPEWRKNYQKSAMKIGTLDKEKMQELKDDLDRAIFAAQDTDEDAVERLGGVIGMTTKMQSRYESFNNKERALDALVKGVDGKEAIIRNEDDYKMFKDNAAKFKINVPGNPFSGDYQSFQKWTETERRKIAVQRARELGQDKEQDTTSFATPTYPNASPAERVIRLTNDKNSLIQQTVNKTGNTVNEVDIKNFVEKNSAALENLNPTAVKALTTMNANMDVATKQELEQTIEVLRDPSADGAAKAKANTHLQDLIEKTGVSDATEKTEVQKVLTSSGSGVLDQDSADVLAKINRAAQSSGDQDKTLQEIIDRLTRVKDIDAKAEEAKAAATVELNDAGLKDHFSRLIQKISTQGGETALRQTTEEMNALRKQLAELFSSKTAGHTTISDKELKTVDPMLRGEIEVAMQDAGIPETEVRNMTVGRAYQLLHNGAKAGKETMDSLNMDSTNIDINDNDQN